MEAVTPRWLKRTVMIGGLALAFVAGLPASMSLLCAALVVVFQRNYGSWLEPVLYGVISLSLVVLTLGAGLAAYWHADRSLKGKPSRPMRLPPITVLTGVFGLLVGIGLFFTGFDILPEFFFPPILLVAAALPPVWAVAWFMPLTSAARQAAKQEGPTSPPLRLRSVQAPERPLPLEHGLTWRRGLLAFAGGATISVFIAIVLEILLPVIVLALVLNLGGSVRDHIGTLFDALAGAEVSKALTSPGFLIIFVQLAVIAPLAEEIAKPLVTLPLLKRSNRQETFLLGAMAGAGFAALENVIYASTGYYIWAGILVVRALGSALHPLCSGLTALGWRDVLRGERNAGSRWLLRFGTAVALHAAWNGGSLLVITLGGARFFGELPPEIDVLGLSAAGTTLAFLVALGLSALWIGRTYGHGKPEPGTQQTESPDATITLSDRSLALWGLACLTSIVPAGIAGLKLWLR
ncbi:MAG: hypothetical protein CVU38_04255 [Chloroflexi bacterium HGW-Chloroflexi-1]|nr:MAG: hypothetical protein CVU38_04255 [Chloroflexi bacterium HGW-Chloroflexi-1]